LDPIRIGWTVAPATSPAARPAPPGVQAGAPHFDTPSLSGYNPGTYWVSATAPHQLLGYVGEDLPGVDSKVGGDKIPVTLTTTPGSAQDARTAYAAMAGRVRGIPATVPVSAFGDFFIQDVELPKACSPTHGCHVTVTGKSGSDTLTIQADASVTLTVGGRPAGGCTIHMPKVAPRARAKAGCDVNGPQMRDLLTSTSALYIGLRERHLLTAEKAWETIDPTALAARLIARGNARPPASPSSPGKP
jgi:hypothetical protein